MMTSEHNERELVEGEGEVDVKGTGGDPDDAVVLDVARGGE